MTSKRTAMVLAGGAAGILLWLVWSFGPWGATSENHHDSAVRPWMDEGAHEPSDPPADSALQTPAPGERASGTQAGGPVQNLAGADGAADSGVRGTVEDVLGHPLGGVRLALVERGRSQRESQPGSPPPEQYEVHTDLDGGFAFQ